MAVVEEEIVLNQVRGRGKNGHRALGLPEGEVEMPTGGTLRAKIFAELPAGFGKRFLHVGGIIGGSANDFKRRDAFADGLSRPVRGPTRLIMQFPLDNHLAMIILPSK
jgi:hypothetical protein